MNIINYKTFIFRVCIFLFCACLPHTLLASYNIKIQKDYSRNKHWPTFTYTAKLKSTALEAFSIFTAFNLQKKYVLKIKKSKVIRQVDPNYVDVEYELSLPWPLPNVRYTNRHTFKIIPEQNWYQVKWKQLKSTYIKQTIGQASFFKKGNSTYIKYSIFIIPSSFFAIIFKNIEKKSTLKTFKSIITSIESFTKNKNSIYKRSLEISSKTIKNQIAYP